MPDRDDLGSYLRLQARADEALILNLEAKFAEQGSFLNDDDTRHLNGAIDRRSSFADQYRKSSDYLFALKVLHAEEREDHQRGVISKFTGEVSLGIRHTFQLLGLEIPSFSMENNPPEDLPQLPEPE